MLLPNFQSIKNSNLMQHKFIHSIFLLVSNPNFYNIVALFKLYKYQFLIQ